MNRRIAPAPNRTAGHTWASGSFPRTRATPAERERRERASAARAARVVADACERKERKAVPDWRFRGGGPSGVGASRAVYGGARARGRARARRLPRRTPGGEEDARLGRSRLRGELANETDREPRVALVRVVRAGDGFETRTAPADTAGGKFVFVFARKRTPFVRASFAASLAAPGDVGDEKSRGVPERGAQTRALRPRPEPRGAPKGGAGAGRDGRGAVDRVARRLAAARRRLGASALAGTKADDKKRDSCRDRDRDPFADATRTNAAELAAVCADGTLLCELVRVLEKKELAGVTWRPASNASRTHNVGKALAAMRRQPAMSPMHLWCEKDVVAADEETVLGLLGDMRACAAYKRAGRR